MASLTSNGCLKAQAPGVSIGANLVSGTGLDYSVDPVCQPFWAGLAGSADVANVDRHGPAGAAARTRRATNSLQPWNRKKATSG